jgi:hypothetical protein
MDSVQAAYIAAMIDGEGVVTIGRQRSTGRRRAFKFSPRVLVTNSHEGLVRFLHEVTGLGLVYRYKHAAREGWSIMLRWQVTHRQAVVLLGEVRPFLVVKARQADVVLAMPRQTKGGRLAVDDAVYAAQTTAYETIKALNVRGPKQDPLLAEFPRDHPALTGEYRILRRHPRHPGCCLDADNLPVVGARRGEL